MSAVYLIVVPLLVAFISILSKKAAPYLLVLVSFLSVVGIYFLVPGTIMIGGFAAPYGISLEVTNFAIAGLYIVNILFFLVITISLNEYKKMASILLVALAGLNGLLLTGDLFNLFVFLEISGIAAYLITTTNKKPLATFSYLVLGTVGSSMYLLGLIILYNMFGTLNMADMAAQIDASGVDAVVVSFPFLLMFIGLGVEAKLLPFNSWVKGILNSANKLSGPMIAAVYAAAMGLLFGRLLNEVFVIDATLALIVTVILLFSIVAGEAMAYASTKVKEILLFSSIAQAALAVLVFFNGFVELGLVMIGANAFAKLVLFVVITHAEKQTGSDEVDNLRGLFANNKLVGVGFTAATLSVLGLPLFVGFVIKVRILVEFFNNSSYLFPAAILLSSVVEGVYFIKLLVKLWNPKGKESTVKFDYVIIYVSLVVALVLVFLGTFSGELVNILDFVAGGVQ